MFGRGVALCVLAGVIASGCSDQPEDLPVETDDSAAALSGQWIACAQPGEFCSFEGTRLVRYGRNPRFTVRTFTNGVQCDAATFGATQNSRAHCDVDLSKNFGAAGSGASGSAAGSAAFAGSPAVGGGAGSVPVAGSSAGLAGSSAGLAGRSGAAGSAGALAAGSGGTAAAGNGGSSAAGRGGAGGSGGTAAAGNGGSGGTAAAGTGGSSTAGRGGAGGVGGAGGASGAPAAGSGGAGSGAVVTTWKSGVQGDPVLDKKSVEAFCSWRGKACGVAHTYTDRSSWENMTRGAGWVFSNFSGFPGLLVVSQGLVPNGRSADMAGCASGQFDQYFKDFGTLMVNQGRAASVVRLGWEFNATFMPWAGTNATQYKQCFQHAATAIRSTNPSVLIDWTINAHGTPSAACNGSSLNCYPGDEYVDIIGIDNYDHAPSATSAADFQRIADAPEGMSWLFNFAKQHGKHFSVGEWGVAPGSDYNTTGENPDFIRWMHDWFAAHAADLAYEAYFNHCDSGDVESNLYRPTGSGCVRQNLNAGSVYKSLFGH